MRYTSFGRRTGLRVFEYALGTANFGTGRGAGAGRPPHQIGLQDTQAELRDTRANATKCPVPE